MDTPTLDGPSARAAYGKDATFDLQMGMAVYDTDGQKLGVVTEVAGFGATRHGAVPAHGADERVTEAQSGTGYFKVSREEVLRSGATDLVFPFHGIQGVTPEGGVIVSAASVSELGRQAEGVGRQPAEAAPTWRSRLQRLLPGKKSR